MPIPDFGNMSLVDLNNYASMPMDAPTQAAYNAEKQYRDDLETYGNLCLDRVKTGGDRPGDPPPKP